MAKYDGCSSFTARGLWVAGANAGGASRSSGGGVEDVVGEEEEERGGGVPVDRWASRPSPWTSALRSVQNSCSPEGGSTGVKAALWYFTAAAYSINTCLTWKRFSCFILVHFPPTWEKLR